MDVAVTVAPEDRSALRLGEQLRTQVGALETAAADARRRRDEAAAQLADAEEKLRLTRLALRSIDEYTGRPEARSTDGGTEHEQDASGEPSSIEAAVVDLLRQEQRGVPAGYIIRSIKQAGLTHSDSSVRSRLSRLVKRGRIIRDAGSLYWASP